MAESDRYSNHHYPDVPLPNPSNDNGYNINDWNLVCKTPFSDQLKTWVIDRLIEGRQDPVAICEALAVDYGIPDAETNQETIFYQILELWQDREHRYLSELVSALSKLERPVLKSSDVRRVVSDIYDQVTNFKFVDSHSEEYRLQQLRQDSGVHLEITAIACTELSREFMTPVEEEKDALITLTELVPGDRLHMAHPLSAPPSSGTTNDRERVIALRIELRALQNKFCSLLNYAYKILIKRGVPIDDLRQYLTQRCADEHGEIPHFSNLMLGILEKATLHKIFIHLSRIGAWHFLSYMFLEDILKQFELLDDEITQRLEVYDRDVTTFKDKTLLLDFLAVWGGRCDDDKSFPGYRTVIAKSVHDPNTFTIAKACEEARFIARQFSLKELSFRLANGGRGSVYIRWLVPAAATRHMLKVMESKELKKPDLLQFGIVQLAIERKVFKSEATYENIHKLSLENPKLFWGDVAAKDLTWRKRSKEVFTHDKQTGEFHWFRDAEINVSENCLDVHAKKHPDKVALIWEKDDESEQNVRVTYRQLLEQTCQVANVLKQKGVEKGDVVAICMPTMPLAVASMLACARIGAIHCVLFPDFNATVLSTRISEVKAKAVITADTRAIGGQIKELKKTVVEAVRKGNTQVEFVLVANRSGNAAEEDEDPQTGDKPCFSLEKEMEKVPSECEPEPMAGEDTLFIAYTSGTQTGTSKKVDHRQAGYLLYTKVTFKFMFSPEPDAIIGCVSDLAWLAAHSYVVYGPLSNGNTTVLFESVANHPNEGRYWRMVNKLKVTHFYTVPSVLKELRIIEKELGKERDKLLARKEELTVEKDEAELEELESKEKELKLKEKAICVQHHDLSSLKVIASGGEPVPVDIQRWYFESVGKNKCLFLDTWGQTELGGTGIVRWEAPEGKERIDFPKSNAFAFFGVDLGELKEGNSEMFLRQPLPGMGKHVNIKEGGYSTGDILECTDPKAQMFRVSERKEKALLVQGGWYSTTAIEDSLRMMYSGICDAQIIANEEQGSLFVVLQTLPNDAKEKLTALKNMAWFYSQAKIGQNQLSKAGLKVKVFFVECFEGLKKCLRTAGGKMRISVLKGYLEQLVGSESSWQDIDPVKLHDYCLQHNPMSPLCV